MKKILLTIAILACLVTVKCQDKSWSFEGWIYQDTIAVAYPVSDYNDWSGEKVAVSIAVQNTEDDDAELFIGGTNSRISSVLDTTDFAYLSQSGLVIDPLVLDTAGTYLKPNVDTTWYTINFTKDIFPRPTPAFRLTMNETDSLYLYILFELRK